MSNDIIRATLENGDCIKLKYGEWNGLEHKIVELDCGYGLTCNHGHQYISSLINLKKLRLNAAGICDLSFIMPLNKIEELECVLNHIVDISPLKKLNRLRELNLDENSIEDLSPLENLVDLEKLFFSDNCVKSLEPIAKLKSLNFIDFVYQRPFIKDLTPLKQLKNLKIGVIGNEFFANAPASYDEIKNVAEKYKDVAGLIKGDYWM